MNRRTFWIISWTWGILMTLAGALTFLVLMAIGYKPRRNQYGYAIEIGKSWGGFSMGPFCLININPNEYIENHEFGHALQNCYYGPFMIIITFASILRYWQREYLVKVRKQTYDKLPDYDDMWFEGTATYLGKSYKTRYKL